MGPKQRELLLVPFPFSNQSGRKVRPVIVISNDRFNENSEDIIVVGVTSNVSKNEYSLLLDNSKLEDGKLLESCCIKVENILKLDKEMIIKKIGKINQQTLDETISKIFKILKH